MTVDGQMVDKALSKAEKDLLAGKLQAVVDAEGWADLIRTGENFLNEHLDWQMDLMSMTCLTSSYRKTDMYPNLFDVVSFYLIRSKIIG